MKKGFYKKISRALINRREWLPRMIREQFLFYFTKFIRFFFPWPDNIILGKNVRIQWPLCCLAELPNSKIIFGDNIIVYENAMIETYGRGHIKIGSNSVIGDNRIYSRGKIVLGERVITS